MIDSRNGTSKLSSAILKLYMKLFLNGIYKLPWLEYVYDTLNNLGLSYLWLTQTITETTFKSMIKQRMKDQYIQRWNEEIYNNSVCFNYRMFKTDFKFENYLTTLERPLRTGMLKFRVSNHKLPIHAQRFLNIPRGERVCLMCDAGEIGDEYHYMFNCKDERIVDERKKALSSYYIRNPNTIKYNSVMNGKSKKHIKNIARFLYFLMNLFK